MPSYRLYPLTALGDPEPPVQAAAFDDAAVMRWAMRRAFPFGCDIWLDTRFVGRVHGPQQAAAPPAGDDSQAGST